jgi:hypothetical protein
MCLTKDGKDIKTLCHLELLLFFPKVTTIRLMPIVNKNNSATNNETRSTSGIPAPGKNTLRIMKAPRPSNNIRPTKQRNLFMLTAILNGKGHK